MVTQAAEAALPVVAAAIASSGTAESDIQELDVPTLFDGADMPSVTTPPIPVEVDTAARIS